MKVLFLDDMQTRHDTFQKGAIGMDVHYTYNAQEAIKALDAHVFDVASLDHDLSIDAIMTEPEPGANDPNEWSGYDVALYIANMPAEKRPKVVVLHSLNPGGRSRMKAALEGLIPVKILPFHG